MTKILLTDAQLAALQRNPEYQHYGSKCPVCLGTGKYKFMGGEFVCPDGDYGHSMLRLAMTYWSANIGLQYQTLDWKDWPHPDALRAEIEEYIERIELLRLNGVGMTLHSKALGVGKTWAATYVLKRLVVQGFDGWFAPFPEVMFMHELEDDDERRYKMGRIKNAGILVLDDVVAPRTERQHGFYSEKLEELIRPRTNTNLPTILTTNLNYEELERYYPRVFSLLSAKNLYFELEGIDARKSGEVWRQNVELALAGEVRPIQ